MGYSLINCTEPNNNVKGDTIWFFSKNDLLVGQQKHIQPNKKLAE